MEGETRSVGQMVMLGVFTLFCGAFVVMVLAPLAARKKAGEQEGKEKGGEGAAGGEDMFTRLVMQFMTDYRVIVICGVVVPLSFIVENYLEVREWIFRTFQLAPKLHEQRVRHVQEQVKRWNHAGLRGKRLMCTARGAWLTMSTRTASFKDDCNRISVDLKDILEVNTEKMTVRTEPLVAMRHMTRTLLPMGYQLAIQVEMEDLTIGGLTMGLGMETTSHKWGLIEETVEAFEIVLSDGTLVRASRDENPDLFRALPWSHGTLGFLVAVEVRIVPVKPYMHCRYVPTHTLDDLCVQMKELSEAETPPTFLEATIYSKDTAVIQIGEFDDCATPEKRAKINCINNFWKPWYYTHVERAITEGGFEEYIPIRQYHHRYTRSVFWELRDLIPFGNDAWYRYLFGWLGAPKVSMLKLTMTPQIRRSVVYKHVVQDIIIPIDVMKEAVLNFHDWFEIYPLLVFPIAIFKHDQEGFLRNPRNLIPGRDCEMFFDLGAYGVPQAVRDKKPWDAHKALRAMEKFTRDVGGYQCLYSDTLMTRTEFRQMFNHELYDEMREKYNAVGAFPEIYDKIKPERGVLEVDADGEQLHGDDE